MATSTGRAGVATSCSVCPSDQAEYTSQVHGRPLCWQCWRGEQIATHACDRPLAHDLLDELAALARERAAR